MERQIRDRGKKVRRKRDNASSSKATLSRGGKAPEGGEEEDMPFPIQRRRTIAKPMSLSEAVSQLHLSKKEFLVFLNSDSGQMNVVCRSKGGDYEWVEPHVK
jgi:putative sigma-54 modulation protein